METMVNNLVGTFNRKRIAVDIVKADGNEAYSRKRRSEEMHRNTQGKEMVAFSSMFVQVKVKYR